jgi:hypothetical protein
MRNPAVVASRRFRRSVAAESHRPCGRQVHVVRAAPRNPAGTETRRPVRADFFLGIQVGETDTESRIAGAVDQVHLQTARTFKKFAVVAESRGTRWCRIGAKRATTGGTQANVKARPASYGRL